MPTVVLHIIILATLLVKVVITPRSSNTAILRILLADGIVYYTATLAAQLVTVIVWGTKGSAFNGLPAYSMWCINIMAFSRFLLSLKTPTKRPASLISMVMTRPSLGASGSEGHGHAFDGDRKEIFTRVDTIAEEERRSKHETTTHVGEDEEMMQKRWIGDEVCTPSIHGSITRSEDDHDYNSRSALAPAPSPKRTVHTSFATFIKGDRHTRRAPLVETVDVAVEDVEWWDEREDHGPGVKDSRVGRYDSWL